jgi:hypothetical protein
MLASFLCQLALAADPATAPAPAEEKKKEPIPVKVAGIVFAHYEYRLTEGADGYNEFALDRAYVQAIGTFSPHWGTKVTLDAGRLSPVTLPDGSSVTVDTRYRVFVKHAYLEWKDDEVGLKVRGGIIDTPYTQVYDGFAGIRYISESFAKQFGLAETADIGVSLGGNHADGLVDWQATVLNGEGYSKLEVDAGKTAQARVTVDPLAGGDLKLPITGFFSYAGDATDQTPLITFAGAAGFSQEYLRAWAEVDGTSTDGASGFGYSATLIPQIPDVLNVIARYDAWDPDTDGDNDATTRIIGGISHDFLPKVSLAATYERTEAQDTPDPSHGVFVHMQAGY